MSRQWFRHLLFSLLLALPLSAMAETAICGSGFEPTSKDCKTFATAAEADTWVARQQAAFDVEAAPLGAQVYDITLAVLKDRFQAGTWPMNGNSLLRCLTILDKDPPRRLLDALTKIGLPMTPGKQSICLEDPQVNLVMGYSFYQFKPVAKGKVEVHWNYGCGRNCAGGYVSEVEADAKGQWTIVRTKSNWMT